MRRETIVFVENGKYFPSLKFTHGIANILEATINRLFIFEDDDIVELLIMIQQILP